MQAGLTDVRILIVEDEALIALMLENVLEERGCRIVGTAASIPDAVRLAEQAPIDVALLDINIGGRQVTPVMAALRARNIPFLLVTGYDKSDLGREYAGYPILRKPLRPSHLIDAVHAARLPVPAA